MDNNSPTLDDLRQELARLRDDLAVLESSRAFAIGSVNYGEDAIEAIKKRIAEIEAILDEGERNIAGDPA